jgi:hypothetical protein
MKLLSGRSAVEWSLLIALPPLKGQINYFLLDLDKFIEVDVVGRHGWRTGGGRQLTGERRGG